MHARLENWRPLSSHEETDVRKHARNDNNSPNKKKQAPLKISSQDTLEKRK